MRMDRSVELRETRMRMDRSAQQMGRRWVIEKQKGFVIVRRRGKLMGRRWERHFLLRMDLRLERQRH